MDFVQFPKIPRLNRDCVITEKIDGTNAQVCIVPSDGNNGDTALGHADFLSDGIVCKHAILAGSRTRWITPKADNAGFARWVVEHIEELKHLGPGQHFGEWWGNGIQRGYGLTNGDKRFSLFNTARWETDRPSCCGVVPVLYRGPFNSQAVEWAVDHLRAHGSRAVPGYVRPEGIVIYHEHSKSYFKVTLENDEMTKGEAEYRSRQEKGQRPSHVSYREHLDTISGSIGAGMNTATVAVEANVFQLGEN